MFDPTRPHESIFEIIKRTAEQKLNIQTFYAILQDHLGQEILSNTLGTLRSKDESIME